MKGLFQHEGFHGFLAHITSSFQLLLRGVGDNRGGIIAGNCQDADLLPVFLL